MPTSAGFVGIFYEKKLARIFRAVPVVFLHFNFYCMRILFTLLLVFPTLISSAQTEGIHWMSFSEAMVKRQSEPKKIFIDMYTDWCGWCKRMDVSTFAHPEVIKYMNAHYYAVKFNTEKENPITVGDSTYKLNPKYGRNGTHELAVELLQGKMSYPTFVFLDERFNLLSPLAGYQTPEQIEPVMRFFGEGIYLTTSWADYQKKFLPNWK